jgi:hypothetical protein
MLHLITQAKFSGCGRQRLKIARECRVESKEPGQTQAGRIPNLEL